MFLLILSLAAGIVGFHLIEHYDWIDAFYMSVITISTVGFGEVYPLTQHGKIFASFYIMFNLGIFAYVVSVFTSYLVEGNLRVIFKNLLTNKEVKELKNHTIICGFGRNGASAFQELMRTGKEIVVVETDENLLHSIEHITTIQRLIGDATSDEELKDAGIERASAIITTLPHDADNVFITLSAKEMNPNITVIARASDVNSEKKLHRAGANFVVMPDKLGGLHMAQIIAKPYVIEFLELLSGVGTDDIVLDEITFDQMKDHYHNETLAELDIRRHTGVSVIGLKKKDQGFQFNPNANTRINVGDVLIIMGSKKNITRFMNQYSN